jgi:hypothetical protein
MIRENPNGEEQADPRSHYIKCAAVTEKNLELWGTGARAGLWPFYLY